MSQTIVFIHRGNSWYLPYTIWQCKQTNPEANIYLIGDTNTRHFGSIIQHVNIDEFKSAGDHLKKVYQHHSTLGADFEIACIERWFILAEFLKRENLNSCLYLDSDILVYSNMDTYAKRYAFKNMTWCSFSAHSNFISNVKALNDYCDLTIKCYENHIPTEIESESLFHNISVGKRQLNISDMTFFHDYNLLKKSSLLAINNPDEWGCFDISMEEVRIFTAANDGFKLVEWNGKTPLCQVTATSEWVTMATLHFQGTAKNKIKQFFKYSSLKFNLVKIENDCRIFLMKIKNAVTNKR